MKKSNIFHPSELLFGVPWPSGIGFFCCHIWKSKYLCQFFRINCHIANCHILSILKWLSYYWLSYLRTFQKYCHIQIVIFQIWQFPKAEILENGKSNISPSISKMQKNENCHISENFKKIIILQIVIFWKFLK